jgi:hypothetical protein
MGYIAKIETHAKTLLSGGLWAALALFVSTVGAAVVLYAIWAIVLMIDGPMAD